MKKLWRIREDRVVAFAGMSLAPYCALRRLRIALIAAAALPVLLAGCSPTNQLRDDYMGKRFLQPGKTRPVSEGAERAEKYRYGDARPDTQKTRGDIPVLSRPVPRDKDGNPILE